MNFGQIAGCCQGRVVDSLENLDVQQPSLVRVERETKSEECICETLNTKRNGTVTEIASSCFFYRIVVHVDDLVQVADNNLCDFVQFCKVIHVVSCVDEGGQSKRCQVADGNFIGSSILNNLSAEVRATNGPEILLVALPVAGVLVQHKWISSLGLRLNNGVPKFLRSDCSSTSSFPLVPVAQGH